MSLEDFGQADQIISGRRAARELTTLIERRMIVSDHGTAFTSIVILAWSKAYKVEWHYIAPGKPMQNATIDAHTPRLGNLYIDVTVILGSLRCVDRSVVGFQQNPSHRSERTSAQFP